MFNHQAMLQLPNALTKRGGNVFLVDGWGSRGAAGRPMASKVYGSIQHWIVSPNRPADAHKNMTLGLIVNGHSTLAGPLANLYLRGDGAIGVVAAGRANHGGVGSWRGVSGNQFWIGTEAEGPPFTEAQMAAYPIILAAVYDVTGQHPRDWAISHQEYAPRRKVDIGPAIIAIRNEAIRLVDDHIFAGDKPVEPDPEPETTEEVDMFLPYDPRFGVYWAVKADLTSKTMVSAADIPVIENLWANSDIKYTKNGLSAATIDAVPTAGNPTLTRVEGTVNADVVGDGVGNA